MRTHLEIIEAAGGYQAVAKKLGHPSERVRFWARRKAIPPDQWKAVADARLATLKELAEAAAADGRESSDTDSAAEARP